MSMFCKRHYEAVAEVIRKNQYDDWAAIAQALSNMFEDDNPKFDKNRFRDAATKKS